MVEITPIPSTQPIIKSRRIQRDDDQKQKKKQPTKHENEEADQETERQPVQHIDEIV